MNNEHLQTVRLLPDLDVIFTQNNNRREGLLPYY